MSNKTQGEATPQTTSSKKNSQPNGHLNKAGSPPNGKRTVWLTLSKGETEYEKVLVLTDIFQWFDPRKGEYQPIPPTELWKILNNQGIIPHPLVTGQYLKAETCIYCGGQVIKKTGINDDRWEMRCSTCNYLFAEDDGQNQAN